MEIMHINTRRKEYTHGIFIHLKPGLHSLKQTCSGTQNTWIKCNITVYYMIFLKRAHSDPLYQLHQHYEAICLEKGELDDNTLKPQIFFSSNICKCTNICCAFTTR